ncbi:sulfotransferase [Nocardioides marmoriginsengisoli]|uniref:Sulfotransferase n=1 Tax=Nocardioides marmoriginsengisoli TaxID=661483 RepID=A0A3N0CGH2_9ACTN|nr:sulfotransferase [Nocardioides marmoriginsengisoli]RNL62554.1 sulfotransferase [Nocardioides marmoriginsengisoli]
MTESTLQRRDRLVDAAIAAAGSDDFGADSWQEGLEIYLASLAESARLNEVGVGVAEDGIVGDLANRLRIEEWRKTHPAVAEQEVRAPIIIVGQPRTGTTILLDLMAQDPANRAPLSWEIERPVPAPRTASFDTDPRIAEAQAGFDLVDAFIPGFASFHELGAQLAQEDVRIFTSDFRSMQHSLQFEVPAYNRWLMHEADMAPAYRWHRRFLQHLQSEHHSERWLLKSPAHLWSLPALMAEYPDAIVIQNHRDPLKVIASISALGASLREMTTDHFEVTRLAAQYGEDIVLGLDRALEARRDGVFADADGAGGRVIDIRYQDIRHDLIGGVARIYDEIGLELTAEAEARMRTFLAAHPGDQGGSLKRYSFAETGLDEGEYRERARAYQEYFDVESEELG